MWNEANWPALELAIENFNPRSDAHYFREDVFMATLALGRKKGQAIVVNGPARIVIGDCRKGHVQLLVEADPAVKVLRDELVGKPKPADESEKEGT